MCYKISIFKHSDVSSLHDTPVILSFDFTPSNGLTFDSLMRSMVVIFGSDFYFHVVLVDNYE